MAASSTTTGLKELLHELAFNLYFSWNPQVRNLYQSIDATLWQESGQNPVAFLNHLDENKLSAAEANAEFMATVKAEFKRFQTYMQAGKTRFSTEHSAQKNDLIAYFSAEYGVSEALPNYAGGLGVLAGDHCKTASDLGLPFVAVGLLYKYAYFSQQIDAGGNQIENYEPLRTEDLPIKLVTNQRNEPLTVDVLLNGRTVYLQIWQAKIGRISLYLLDTNLDKNSPEDRDLLHALYGGSRETRIQQEIILGIGGVRALKKMKLAPTVFHMNEGHSAFLSLERLVDYIDDGMSFNSAMEMVRSTNLFTTHTPIPAGNETFEFEMMETYFSDLWPRIGMSKNQFFDLGRNKNIHEHENFSLTILALNLSYMANGVSALHGEVSRRMWQKVFPGIPTDEVPIGHVTNGIHTESWLHPLMIDLFDKHFGSDWRDHIHESDYWDGILEIPDAEYWQTLQALKVDMAEKLSARYREQLTRYGDQYHGYPEPAEVFDKNMLTIGFARRFAPYKRATLIFKDPERLKRILNNPDRPVQILFAGKAHPHNDAGKELIRTINQFSKEEGFRGRIVFIEGYSMHVSRALISGSDVWLNTPRRPLEASGTSGQKVNINGGINFSILDGWWPEGYNGKNGWTIGDETEHPDYNQQDYIDSQSFYETLENELIPAYYDRDENNLPLKWITISKESLRSLLTKFSTRTMVWNYTEKYYVPGMKRNALYTSDDSAPLFKYTRWVNRVNRHWKSIQIMPLNGIGLSEDQRILSAGESREISVRLDVDGLKPEELRVELILERQDAIKGHQQMEVYPMGIVGKTDDNTYEYKARVKARTNGTYRFNCRVMPTHPDMYQPQETRLIKWLD